LGAVTSVPWSEYSTSTPVLAEGLPLNFPHLLENVAGIEPEGTG
jgi:hypothetical protein